LGTLIAEDPSAASQIIEASGNLDNVLRETIPTADSNTYRDRLLGTLATVWGNDHDYLLGFDAQTESRIARDPGLTKEAKRYNRILSYSTQLAVWETSRSEVEDEAFQKPA
jgi:hypothetical protein